MFVYAKARELSPRTGGQIMSVHYLLVQVDKSCFFPLSPSTSGPTMFVYTKARGLSLRTGGRIMFVHYLLVQVDQPCLSMLKLNDYLFVQEDKSCLSMISTYMWTNHVCPC